MLAIPFPYLQNSPRHLFFYFFSNYASFPRKIVSLMTEGHLCDVYSKVEKYIDLLDGSRPVGTAGTDCILALQRQSKWEIR